MTGRILLRIIIVAIVVGLVVVLVLNLLGIKRNAGMLAAIAAGVSVGPMALVALRMKDVK
jgi:hypothetical protein